MANLGSDFTCTMDLEPGLVVVEGRECLAQAIGRRLGTPKGGLFYDQSYGYDLTDLLSSAVSPFVVQQQVQSEILADERVERATSRVTRTEEGDEGASEETIGNMAIEVQAADGDGPFGLTIDVSAAGLEVELLE